jgi:lipoprotein-anchoring transpeptidase ErfK/SrfK
MIRFLPIVAAILIVITLGLYPRQTNELSSDRYVAMITSSQNQFDKNVDNGIWFNQTVPVPSSDIANIISQAPNVLGQTSEEKWIEIDLGSQKLMAHEGSKTVMEFPISSGLPWMPTVTGEFRIWAKVLSQRMSGGSVADGTYYNLPNVPFVQYFHKGYGIHGAYWHNDFGKPRSHGCINMRTDDAKALFYWTNPTIDQSKRANYKIDPASSTRVVVHGTTPTKL